MKPYYTALLIISALAAVSQAAPPTITAITPRGVERGKPIEVIVTGANLTPDTNLWTSFDAEIKRLPDAKPNPAQARFLITASPKAPIGIFLLRAFSAEGVSAPTPFAVDPFPSSVEKEDNNTPDKAQLVPIPIVIDGQCAGGDVDFYRFEAKKGQRLVIETEAARLGSGMVPHLRLTDGKGRFLASDDSQRLRGDARLLFTAPADGSYLIELADSRYRAAAPPQYRLKIGEYDAVDEIFPLGFHKDSATRFTWLGGNALKDWHWEFLLKIPGDGLYSPRGLRLHPPTGWKEGMAWPEIEAGVYKHQPIEKGADPKTGFAVAIPATIPGRLDKPGLVHRFALDVKEDQRLRFTLQAQSLGSYLDAVLRITDDKDKLLVQADDVDVPAAPGQQTYKSADPVLDFTVPKGLTKIRVELRDGLGRGGINFGYLLTIEPATADFQLRLLSSEANIPRGGFAVIPIGITRRGYDGPIQLECKNPPPGWKFEASYVPAKATSGALLVRTPDAPPSSLAPLFLSIAGKALDGPPIQDIAEFRLLLSKEGNPAVATAVLDKLAVGLDSPSPLRLEGPPSIDLVLALQKNLPIKLSWVKDAKEIKDAKTPLSAVEVSIVGLGEGGKPLPGGVTTKPASLPAAATSGDILLTAPTTMPDGRTHDLILQAKTKLAGKDVTIIGPAVRVQILRPFELIVEEKHTLTPGQAYVLKGTLKRQPGFKDAVQLKLDTLPPGVTATPIKPIPGDQSAFQIDLKTDAKANPAMTNPTLAATATITGMAYTHPARKLTVAIQKK